MDRKLIGAKVSINDGLSAFLQNENKLRIF